MLTQPILTDDDASHQPGALDGLTILRYAHLYRNRTSGGVEQYLRHLDRGLLHRHRLTVLQMHLTYDDRDNAIQVEEVGLGRILWVPVPVRHVDTVTLADLPSRIRFIGHHMLGVHQQEGQGKFRASLSFTRELLRHKAGHLRYGTTILSDRIAHLLTGRKIDLMALHWLSYDTDALIARAVKAQIPFVFINHFHNGRLAMPATRKSIVQAAAVGTVSDHGVPAELQGRYVNLSDAVDTEFFSPDKASLLQSPLSTLVLLPGRIQEGKGHRDLIEAARILLDRRVDLIVGFIGATDSEPMQQQLFELISARGLQGRVMFLGERTAEQLRDWYAQSTVVVLPSYAEGLPRIVLEAQAMEKPIVAYDAGGTSQAVLANETAMLVKTGDVKALADKIQFLLQNESARLDMGRRGREYVCRQFGLAALIERHERLYAKVIFAARPARHLAGRPRACGPRVKLLDADPRAPLVSILIPAYNAERSIASALQSAIAQTWPHKEIIVVDDGSTDGTLEAARRFAADGVRVIHQENQGAAGARNTALSASRGDYIQWLDADDLLAPDKVASQMELAQHLNNRRVLLSSSWGQFLYRHHRAEFIPTPLWRDLSPVEWLICKLEHNVFMQTAVWLVSRELTEAAGPWNAAMLGDDDGEYFCRILKASEGVRFVPQAKVYYRGPGLAFGSLSYSEGSGRRLNALWASMRLHVGYLRSMEDSDRTRAACLKYLNDGLIFFYPEMPDIVAQMQAMARELGGVIAPPRLPAKYSWLKTVFGWHLAKRSQRLMRRLRWALERHWDKTMFEIEGHLPKRRSELTATPTGNNTASPSF